MSSIVSKFNNNRITKWWLTSQEEYDSIVYIAKRIDGSGRLRLYGTYSEVNELINDMNEAEEPFSFRVVQEVKTRKPGVLPMGVKKTEEVYSVKYATCLSWFINEFELPNDVVCHLTRKGLTMTYRSLEEKAYAEMIFKSFIRVYKCSYSSDIEGAYYTDDWNEVVRMASERGEILIDGPMELSYVYQKDDGRWSSWGEEDESLVNLMLRLCELGAVRHKTNTMYRSADRENILGRLTKSRRHLPREAVIVKRGHGVIQRESCGTAWMSRISARYEDSSGKDAFREKEAPNSFKTYHKKIHYSDRYSGKKK